MANAGRKLPSAGGRGHRHAPPPTRLIRVADWAREGAWAPTLRRMVIRVADGSYIFGLEDAVEVEAARAADVHYLVFVQIS